ncbi:MAG: hypothetical protein ACREIV_04040 [Planctomycetaceae bacterium]
MNPLYAMVAAAALAGAPTDGEPSLDELIERIARSSKEDRRPVAQQGFGTARSPNFTVTVARDPALARDLLARAESLREDIALRWIGSPLPEGVAHTVIHLHRDDAADVGRLVPADGVTQTRHWLWLRTSRERALGTTLAHEMTHVVLSTRFPEGMPVWANEGIASLEDDAERHAIRRERLAHLARSERWPSVAEVMSMPHISPDDTTAYSVAVSLTEFLLERGPRGDFLRFVETGADGNWNAALRRFYKIDGTADLQREWQVWLANRER